MIRLHPLVLIYCILYFRLPSVYRLARKNNYINSSLSRTINIINGFIADTPAVSLMRYHLFLLAVFSYLRFVSTDDGCRDESTGLCELGLTRSPPYCWGYEANCSDGKQIFERPVCEGTPQPWVNTMEEKVEKFWRQADFGYVQDFLSTIRDFCVAKNSQQGGLSCSQNMRYCYARHLVLDFREYDFDTRERFRDDIHKRVSIGSDCTVDTQLIGSNGDQKGELQSWYNELKEFRTLSLGSEGCDVMIQRPVVFLKLDAGVNMYHHFCDYVNLYASQHINGSFSRDVELVRWDTGKLYYSDLFDSVWRTFSHYPERSLSQFSGKVVCLREAMFPLLPRMFYGLYYNMPLVPDCYGSGLMKAFSKHILARLNLKRYQMDRQVQVTLVPRNTKFRNILNQNELVSGLKTLGIINLTVIEYNHGEISFQQQLAQTHKSDIFITMHGAGLTHLLFLPDWGAVIELYNCGDSTCYRDLASIRGVKYFTWQEPRDVYPQDEGHHPTLGPHKKFTNYSFGLKAFIRLVMKAVDYVIQHKPSFKQVLHSEL